MKSLFTHLLVPLDGSRLAEAVLPAALGLAAVAGARVTLLHVLERNPPPTVHGEPHLTDGPTAERYLAALAARLADAGSTLDWHVHANAENDVTASIVAHAQELRADLIALTPHGRGNLRRWLIGSIPQLVLQRGITPVLLVPPSGTTQTPVFAPRHLLVPLDGSAAAQAVLPLVQALERACGAAVRLVQVVPTLGTVRGDQAVEALLTPLASASALDLAAQAAATHLAQVAAAWPGPAVPDCQVLRGGPAAALLELITQTNPDLIVLSTHGRAGLSGRWAASVATRVVERSPRPLLLLRLAGAQANGG